MGAETLSPKKEKRQSEVAAQITRIASKLTERAAKLPEDLGNDPDRLFHAFHNGKKTTTGERYRLDADIKDGSQIGSNGADFPRRHTVIDRSTGESHVGVTADWAMGSVDGARSENYGRPNQTTTALTLEEAVHETAKNLSDLRGEVAAREIQRDK